METEHDVKTMTMNDLAGILRRRKWTILLPALGVFTLSVVVAFSIPKTYKSTTTILIEEQGIPREYVTANITTFADQRLQSINQRIMGTTKLLDLITRFRLYEDLKARHTIDEIAEKMRKDIVFNTISADVKDPRSGRTGQATIAFSVSYKGKNPETVQRIASELASFYLEENLKIREKASADTSKFMEDERGNVQAMMAALEAKIAVYKQKHGDSLPELAQANLQGLDQVERDMSRMEDQLHALKERESYLEQELASVSQGTANQGPGSLQELRTRLVGLKSRFSDKHPDVIRTKAAIKEFEAQSAAPAKEASATQPDNPIHIPMKSQLAGTRTEIESVQRQIKSLRQKRDSYRQRVESSPRVEEGYRGLLVERNNLQAKFEELNRKAMDAQVAYGMEKEQLGERFSILEAARLPGKPDSPNIRAILLIGLVLGLGCGVGTAAIKESTDDSVRDAGRLAADTGFLVLTGIPEIVTPMDVARKKMRRIQAAAGAVAVLLAGVLVVHFFVMDMDVVLAKLSRKLGI
ncbi:GumC family protein [Candidatus Deferrimicrobium sp.]|uniref:GumC family protein n=1 Tax=Candidatus Deferrimicrobium sp. TaxID=3060586 RepID=UPI002ED2D65E